MTGTPTFGVLLVNLGSPEAPTSRAVRAFLREFLADRRVVDLPRLRWWLIRHLFILPTRPRRSARLYRKIWTSEGSPLLVTTNRIGRGLASDLTDSIGFHVPVETGMRYGSPSIATGLRRLADAGCPRVLLLPLYPQHSSTTTASAHDAVAGAIKGWDDAPELRSVPAYYDHLAYIEALATGVQNVWDTTGSPRRLLVSFHGIPRRYADAGDPYPAHCAATTKALVKRLDLPPGRWHMAYQSQFGREPWLRPDLGDRLQRWGQRRLSGVDVICPGFAADCLETLEEVAIAGRGRFEAAGGRAFRYIPALNDQSKHISALTKIALETADDWVDQKTSRR